MSNLKGLETIEQDVERLLAKTTVCYAERDHELKLIQKRMVRELVELGDLVSKAGIPLPKDRDDEWKTFERIVRWLEPRHPSRIDCVDDIVMGRPYRPPSLAFGPIFFKKSVELGVCEE